MPTADILSALPFKGADEILTTLFQNIATIGQSQVIDNTRDSRRRASNDATFDHLVSMAVAAGLVQATQSNEDQSVASTGKTETTLGAEQTADATVAASLGNLLTALQATLVAAGGTVTVESLTALLPLVVQAVGNSVSQTKGAAS